MDYHDVVIHIFLQPFREFYALEDLWAEAPKVLVEESPPAPAHQETFT
jgi:ribosome-associated protein